MEGIRQRAFEPNVEDLRYRLPSINERALLVWWSQHVINQIEKTQMLKQLQEFSEGRKTPKCKETLEKYLKELKAIRKTKPALNS
jgi:hypothetical protein